MKIRKIRAGLYEATRDGKVLHIEDRVDISPNSPLWTVTNPDALDPWLGDFGTKRAAIAAIDNYNLWDR
ncbi:hypothetical protein [Mycobacterium phage PP]|uniref:Uncharacterized protein n=1 Tax=Mycobacterium phage PP TaxID=2077134 RepID=A0A2Z5XVD6_9CAUD|nr:hypothetical protein KIW36_gp11 [Mycobacterium phage PP]BBC53805.1 hypothetical protein [Mycobacterium phage PP]